MPLPRDLCIVTSAVGSSIDFNATVDIHTVKDKTAIVTGGANGIGRAIARALAAQGAHVAIVDLQDGAGLSVEQELSSEGWSVKFFKVDTASYQQQAAMFKAVLAWKKHIDIVVAAAGIGATDMRALLHGREDEEPIAPPTHVLEVNLIGVYYTAYLALFYFNKLAPGRSSKIAPQLLLISSLAGYVPCPSIADYCCAKFGVRGLWKTIRTFSNEFGSTQTNMLAPTYLDTNMIAPALASLQEGAAKVADTDDAVAAAMQAICDPSIHGRAISVVSGQGRAGARNFDLDDDVPGGDGNAALRRKVAEDAFGPICI